MRRILAIFVTIFFIGWLPPTSKADTLVLKCPTLQADVGVALNEADIESGWQITGAEFAQRAFVDGAFLKCEYHISSSAKSSAVPTAVGHFKPGGPTFIDVTASLRYPDGFICVEGNRYIGWFDCETPGVGPLRILPSTSDEPQRGGPIFVVPQRPVIRSPGG